MIRQLLEQADLTVFAKVPLIIFVVVFLAVVIRTLCRPREQVDYWANLPIDDGEANASHRRSHDG